MAHLWRNIGSDTWAPAPVDAHRIGPGLTAAIRSRGDGGGAWTLLASPGGRVLINGFPISIGMSVLSDRDEIRLPDGSKLYFSAETLAVVAPYPDSGTRGVCPRCRQAIVAGTPAVRCPGCGLYHHASDELACWTYGPTCAGCSQDTALDAGFRWTPEDL